MFRLLSQAPVKRHLSSKFRFLKTLRHFLFRSVSDVKMLLSVASPTGNSSTAGGRPEEGDGASSRGESVRWEIKKDVYFKMTLMFYCLLTFDVMKCLHLKLPSAKSKKKRMQPTNQSEPREGITFFSELFFFFSVREVLHPWFIKLQ